MKMERIKTIRRRRISSERGSRLSIWREIMQRNELVSLVLAATAAVLLSPFSLAQEGPPERPVVIRGAEQIGGPVHPREFRGDVRSLPTAPVWQPGDPIKEIPRRGRMDMVTEEIDPRAAGIDPLLERQMEAQAVRQSSQLPSPIFNFQGHTFNGVTPPDPVGDVGEDHYIQMTNHPSGSIFTIYDKHDASVVAGPIVLSSLAPGGSCANGLGDPIVVYDQLAKRWLLSEFSQGGNRLCVYISQTSDPVSGGWYSYDFQAPGFPDYPKYAVWHDAYYVSTNESQSAAYALDRANMLIGASTRPYQRFSIPGLNFGFNALIPSDLDGDIPPPAGAPNFFMRHRDDEVHNSRDSDPTQDFLEIYEFKVDFDNAANSTFTGPFNVPVSEFDSNICGLISFSCFPQPGPSPNLDPIREVVMWRLQYRNFGSHEALVGNFVVDVTGTNQGGIRWFELRKADTSPWSLFQEGTYSPDSTNRWMGSVAMDGGGNILLGYNVVSSSVFPGLRYAGRFSDDPHGALPQGEFSLITGSGSNSSNRYGDYNSMNLDPVDDCTFWFTGEYNPTSAWATRIGAFRFDDCQQCDPAPVANAGPDQSICPGDSATIGTPGLGGHSYLWTPSGQTTAQITVSPAQTTQYALKATTLCGEATDTVTVFVDSAQQGGINEDFEQGLGQWTTTGLWHLVSNSTCAQPRPGYSSPVNAVYYGQDSTCNYNTGAANSGALVSPEIGGINADSTLSFMYFRRVESSSSPVDKTEVHVLTNGGATSTTVWSQNATDASLRNWLSSGPISLAQFAGQVIQIRFFFDTVDASANSFTGWFIDDVVVTASSPCGNGNTAPQVSITSPSDGAVFSEGEVVNFTGSASDVEDGDLTSQIQWTSSLDGALGSGGSVSAALSNGGHLITASVTDSGGLSDSDSINITVGEPEAFSIAGPTPGTAGATNCFNVTGASPGGQVSLYVSANPGSSTVSGCTAPLSLSNPRLRDTKLADGNGNATLCLLVSASQAGSTMLHQAVDTAAPGCQVSNVVGHTY